MSHGWALVKDGLYWRRTPGAGVHLVCLSAGRIEDYVAANGRATVLWETTVPATYWCASLAELCPPEPPGYALDAAMALHGIGPTVPDEDDLDGMLALVEGPVLPFPITAPHE